MPGSSLRNSVHRRNHKERSQPLARRRLGLLEKKKDYVLRARDYASKKARLRALQSKAAFRNKDEFYYGMIKGRTKGGMHVGERGPGGGLPVDVVKVLKTQDVGYVRTQINVDQKQIEQLKTQLHALADLLPSPSASSGLNGDDGDSDFSDDDASDAGANDLSQDDEVDLALLVKYGVIEPDALNQVDESKVKMTSKGKGKMPYKQNEVTKRGHVFFADDREELASFEIPSVKKQGGKVDIVSAQEDEGEQQEEEAQEQENSELGWIDPTDPKGKKKRQSERKKTKTQISSPSLDTLTPTQLRTLRREQKSLDKALALEARAHRQRLLAELSGRLSRVENLKEIEKYMNLQRQMMGKGAHIKKRDHERVVHPEDEQEDGMVETGGKLGWKTKVIKWKAERKR